MKFSEYLILSKSLNFGIIAKFTKNKFLIITVLPVGKQQPKENTIKVIVESYDNRYSKSFCEYISNFLKEVFDKKCDVENIKLKLNGTKLETIFVDNNFLYNTFDECCNKVEYFIENYEKIIVPEVSLNLDSLSKYFNKDNNVK